MGTTGRVGRTRLLLAAAAAAGVVTFPAGAARAPQPQSETTPLTQGVPVERPLAGRDRHAYSIALRDAEHASITVKPSGLDVQVELRDAHGTVLATFSMLDRTERPQRLALVAQAATEYHLSVSPRFPKTPDGRYEIRLDGIRPAVPDDFQRFEAQQLSTRSAAVENAGKAAEALTLVRRARELTEGLAEPDDRHLVYLLTREGDLEARVGRANEGEQILQRAIELGDARLGRDDPQTAFARSRLGRHYMLVVEDFARAEPLLEEGVRVTERALGPSHPNVATNIMPLALLYTLRRDFASAIPLLQRGLDITERSLAPDDFNYLAFVNNLGDAYVQLNDYERAAPIVTQALHAIEQAFGADHIRVTNPLLNLGIIAREQQDYPRAFEYLWRAHAIRSKALGERSSQAASILISIGNIHHAQGAFAEAMSTFRRALDVLESTAGPYHSLTMMTLANMARSSAAAGDGAGALQYQSRVEAIVEKNIAINMTIGSERQKLAYFESTTQRTDRTLTIHAQSAPDDPAAARLAARVILQRKGRVLDAMSGSFATLRERMTPDAQTLLDDLRATTTRLASLALGGPGTKPVEEYRRELASLEDQQESLEARISRLSAAFRAATRPLTLQAVQAAIPSGAMLVEFIRYRPYVPKARTDAEAFGPARYAAYVIGPNGDPQHVDIGPALEVDRGVAALRDALQDPKRTDVKVRARTLDRLVFEPVRARTAGATRVLISPDGLLHLVPFEALVDARGRYAVETTAISYLTSGRDLLRMQVPRASRAAPLIVANPSYGVPAASGTVARASAQTGGGRGRAGNTRDLASVYFSPLSGTASEARAIQSLFPGATVLTEGRATKAALMKADAPRILHIASHGFFLDDDRERANPLLRSGMALAGANRGRRAGENGILTALEAANLNLWGTQLVTLSACDTGVGEIRHGEGVYGLRRAFVLAGAETVLMTLWPVSDYATRQMMSAYYANLTRGTGRGDSLRQAQLQMMRRPGRQHPFYWAGYIQAGAWSPLATR